MSQNTLYKNEKINNRQDIFCATISFLLMFIPLFIFYQSVGINIVGDSITYIADADYVIKKLAAGSDIIDVAREFSPFYVVCIFILALVKYFGGNNWASTILFTNALFYSLCAPCVYLIYRLCGGKRGAIAIVGSAILPMVYPEALFLGNIPLRDIPFTGGAAVVWLIVVAAMQSKPRITALLLTILSCLMLTLFRPNSSIFIVATILLFIFARWSSGKKWLVEAKVLLTVHLLLGVSILVVVSYWFAKPFELPVAIINNLLSQIRDLNRSGMIVIDHVDIMIASPKTFGDYFYQLLLKMICYFKYWNPSQSSIHLIFRHIYFGALFANLIYCTFCFLSGSKRYDNYNLRKLIFFTLNLALAGAFLHSILVLAFEFRYQMIIFPGIWVLFLLNGTTWIQRFGSFLGGKSPE